MRVYNVREKTVGGGGAHSQPPVMRKSHKKHFPYNFQLYRRDSPTHLGALWSSPVSTGVTIRPIWGVE